ncbi:Sporulation domain protein [Magnetococcus marinus MC-1]|uniref:Sporulation domain protein n=1 Tax=Magnetococcus marinus (strain ATCC BAA-1437 / JCM 17883 / MC-1) TaxID=156889 RepID=A0L655_MAGMM|nr:AAA family ATPase [Magnetococcus marinus]ABK43448.1 Sporulation domain protein [Magnetococcus marinus MC-1]
MSAPQHGLNPTPSNRAPAYGELYLEFLGLIRPPFPVVPDAENFYLPARLDVLIAEITHGILTRKGFMVITGEVGCGKTTITRRILHTLEHHPVESALIINTFYQGVELIEEICHDFGIALDEDGGLGNRLKQLNRFLIEKHKQGKICTIIFDDAQNLSHESLELVRMISNLETEHEKLVQILLVGQSELSARLDEHALRQLKSRIVILGQVTPFNADEMKQYIHFRLNRAGSGGVIGITEQAYARLFNWTGGNPRLINKLMDRTLYGLFAENTTRIEAKLVDGVAAEVGLTDQWGRPNRRSLWTGSSLIRYVLAAAGGGLLVMAGLYLAGVLGVPQAPWRGDGPVVISMGSPSMAEAPLAALPAPMPSAPMPSADNAVENAVSSPASATAPQMGAEDAPFYVAVHHFLSDKGLQRHTKSYLQALQEGWLETLAQHIHNESGYRLVRLNKVPDALRKSYLLLKYNDPVRGESFHLLWKPERWLAPDQVGPRNEASAHLQRMLAMTPFYKGLPDGMIGPESLNAIKAFQRAYDLPESGQPDAETQFMLAFYVRKQLQLSERLQQNKAHIPQASNVAVAAQLDPTMIELQPLRHQPVRHNLTRTLPLSPLQPSQPLAVVAPLDEGVIPNRTGGDNTAPAAQGDELRYAVQVATFQTQTQAVKLTEQLQQSGMPAFVQQLDAASGGVWHVVRMGPYFDGAVAVQARDQIKKRYQLSAIIVHLKRETPHAAEAQDGVGHAVATGE